MSTLQDDQAGRECCLPAYLPACLHACLLGLFLISTWVSRIHQAMGNKLCTTTLQVEAVHCTCTDAACRYCVCSLTSTNAPLSCCIHPCRYNAWNYTRLDSSGQFIRHNIPMGDVAVHYRGGSIIPTQPYANLTRVVRYTPVTLLVTIPAHPSGTPGAPLAPYATEEACAAVHAAHAGQLVSCGVLFMDTPDDVDITPGNSVEVSMPSGAPRY